MPGIKIWIPYAKDSERYQQAKVHAFQVDRFGGPRLLGNGEVLEAGDTLRISLGNIREIPAETWGGCGIVPALLLRSLVDGEKKSSRWLGSKEIKIELVGDGLTELRFVPWTLAPTDEVMRRAFEPTSTVNFNQIPLDPKVMSADFKKALDSTKTNDDFNNVLNQISFSVQDLTKAGSYGSTNLSDANFRYVRSYIDIFLDTLIKIKLSDERVVDLFLYSSDAPAESCRIKGKTIVGHIEGSFK